MQFLALAGERVALRFTWGHLAGLRDLLGQEFDLEIQRAIETNDFPRMAEILAVLSGHTPGAWMEESPPIVPTARAITDGLIEAFHGPTRKPAKSEAAEGVAPFVIRARTYLAGLFARLRPGSRAAA